MKVCKNHPDRKAVARGLCKSCYNGWHLRSDPIRIERKRQQNKEWRDSNPNHLREYLAKNAERISKRQRSYRLLRDYGLSPEMFVEMSERQNGMCAICRKVTLNPGEVDHRHGTRIIRGLLCSGCNTALGLFKEDIQTMQSAICYVSRGLEAE